MTTKITGALIGALRALLIASLMAMNLSFPARAQFVQGNIITSAAGTANAQTGTLANATSYASILNVMLIYVPGASNTGSATIALSGLGGLFSGGPITFEKPNGSGLTALVGGELVTGQPVIVRYDGTYMDVLGPVTLPINAANLANSALGFNLPPNLQINASVGSNQLTISVVGNNGSNASVSNPIPILFRDTTIANGDPVPVSLQAAQSITISSGNTMGCVSGQMCRLWEWEINNAGTLGLCIYNTLSGTAIVDLNEANLQTSAGSTTGGSLAQTLYCNIASVAAKAVRRLGYVDVVETTAGTWAAIPTIIQLFGPGIHKPGETVQGPIGSTGSSSASIVPTAAADLVEIVANGNSIGSGPTASAASISTILKQAATTLGTQTCASYTAGSSAAFDCPFSFDYLTITNSTSSISYSVTQSSSGASTGGINNQSFILREIST